MKIEYHHIKGYETVATAELEGGLTSIIAIHNTKFGPSLGGVRFYDYKNKEDAFKDVLRLSEAMSFKAALAHLKLGGGKAVIIGNPLTQKSNELLESFGEFINQLEGRYISAKDVGISTSDLDVVLKTTKYVTGTSKSQGDPSPSTALGVFYGIQACLDFLDVKLETQKIMIQGLGHVGFDCARLLKKAELFGVDVNQQILNQAESELNITIEDFNNWQKKSFTGFCPCALGGIINQKSIVEFKKNGIFWIAGAANNQLENPEVDGKSLHENRILYAPDFVINAGGLIHVASEVLGYSDDVRQNKIFQIRETLKNIFHQSQSNNVSTAHIAFNMARMLIDKGSL